MIQRKFAGCSSRRGENPNSKAEQREAEERKSAPAQARKRHRATALQEAVATACPLLVPQGLGVRQPYAAFTSVPWQGEIYSAPISACSRRRLRFSSALRFCFVSVSLFFLTMALFGCSKSGPSKDVSSNAFDSAPADVKQSWSDGMGAWKSHRYGDAATNFISLQARSASLSIEQSNALSRAVEEFGQEAFTAANKGDAGATEAVKALRASSGRRSVGR
jgi:hypothetical protein